MSRLRVHALGVSLDELVDEMHVAIAPVLLGAGESLFSGLDLPRLGYRCTEHVTTPAAMHVVLRRDV